MDEVLEPQLVYEKISGSAFGHKNGKVREETLYLLQNTLNRYGTEFCTCSTL